MNDRISKNQSSNSNSEDSIKNEEYLLGFSSQYKINIYKDEYEENNKQSLNDITLDSTSISQEYNINPDIRKNGIYDYQRKISSPLFDYLKGSYKYIFGLHKKTIDIRRSHNFIRKDNFFRINKKQNNININNISQKINEGGKHEKENIEKNNIKNFSFYNNNISNNYNPNINSLNNINSNYNCNNNNINNNYLFYNNSIPQQIFNINYINLNNFNNDQRINSDNTNNKRKMTYNKESAILENYFNNLLNNNEIINQAQQNNQNSNPVYFCYNREQNNLRGNFDISNKKNMNTIKFKKKPFDKRKGDWNCLKCNNLNFSFRTVCNRCKIPKPIDLDKNDE